MQQVEGNDRLHHVQLKLPCLRSQSDRQIVPDDRKGHLVNDFGGDGVVLFGWSPWIINAANLPLASSIRAIHSDLGPAVSKPSARNVS
jgi:hypothetical protein